MNKRNYGIDVLKIVSIHMVIILHIMGQGGCLNASVNDGMKYYLNYFLETISYAAVDIFAIITGYLSAEKLDISIRKILIRWLQIEFYSIVGMIICLAFGIASVSTVNFKVIFLPISFIQWGYATSYMLLLFFEPFINIMISYISIQKKQLLFFMILIISIWTTVTGSDFFRLQNGYAPLWIFLLYIIGGILRSWKKEKLIPNSKISICCSVICPLVAFFSKIVLDRWGEILNIENSEKYIRYTSPFILVYAISLVILFSDLEINKRVNKFVLWGSSVSFGVYLGHTQVIFREALWTDNFIWINSLPIMIIPIVVLFLAVAIFIVFGLCERIREKMFSLIFNNLFKIEHKL